MTHSLARIRSCGLLGLQGFLVDVEVDIANGLPAFDIVGLPQATVREARERVRAAVRNSGCEFPLRRITVSLSPADVRKEGTHFDLPIALGILRASGQLGGGDWERWFFIGGLALDGRVRPVTGVLPMGLTAHERRERLVLPAGNLAEAGLVRGLDANGVYTLEEVLALLSGRERGTSPRGMGNGQGLRGGAGLPALDLAPARVAGVVDGAGAAVAGGAGAAEVADLADVQGQGAARRALEVAAAGGHNLLLIGPPGSGKTLLASCLPGILPSITEAEALEVTKIYSVAGLLPPGAGLVDRRPFRRPHHSASVAALLGGGTVPRPGEVSLAHHGVLFLDELAEFSRASLEALRQVLEERLTRISRAGLTLRYPASFMLVGAMNPCPCGFHADGARPCRCTPLQVQRYRSRVSGPLLDRFDLHVSVPREPYTGADGAAERAVAGAGSSAAAGPRHSAAGAGAQPGESARVRARVEEARRRQAGRLREAGLHCNARMGLNEIRRFCSLDDDGDRFLVKSAARYALSTRACHRILRVARTITDLGGEEAISLVHLAEAVQLRCLDLDQGIAGFAGVNANE